MSIRGKRRTWSDEEKWEICQQASLACVSVAQVARRYAVNANLIHKWMKDTRFAPCPDESGDDGISGEFLAVEVDGDVLVPLSGGEVSRSEPVYSLEITHPVSPQTAPAVTATRVDLILSDGRRILVEVRFRSITRQNLIRAQARYQFDMFSVGVGKPTENRRLCL